MSTHWLLAIGFCPASPRAGWQLGANYQVQAPDPSSLPQKTQKAGMHLHSSLPFDRAGHRCDPPSGITPPLRRGSAAAAGR
ncbi:hypothetical protein, partial [Xanthomonas oryzae]